MSSGNKIMRGFLGSAGNGARRVAKELVDDSFARGFDEAASISVGVLSKNIDDLLNKIKSGSYLTDQEQFLLSRLTEMKAATEKDLRDFWGSTATYEGR